MLVHFDSRTVADFASCPLSSKSTSGIFVVAKTGDCVFPLHWVSRKQSSAARSTTEAETISLATAMFSEVENLQGHLVRLRDPCALYAGQQHRDYYPKSRILSKASAHAQTVHRVNVASVSERLTEPNVQITYCPTKEQRANGFTKVISPQEWSAMLEQLCLSSNDAVAAPAQGPRPEDPLAGTDPESVAGILPHRLTEQHILQLFCLLPCDDASRAVISTEGRSFTTGAFAHGGGIIGLRTNTHKFRGVTAVLTRFVRQQAKAKGLSFTAVAVFHGCQFQLHSDKYNDPASYNYVYPLTRVDGGQIWVADPAGEDQCPEHSCNLAGRILELPALFRPTIKHCTVPWTGATDARVVLVAFTPRVPHELSVSDRRVLIELGFRVPCSS